MFWQFFHNLWKIIVIRFFYDNIENVAFQNDLQRGEKPRKCFTQKTKWERVRDIESYLKAL